MASRPWYSSGSGGIVSHASSVSSATIAVDVAGLDGVGEAADDLALQLGVRAAAPARGRRRAGATRTPRAPGAAGC